VTQPECNERTIHSRLQQFHCACVSKHMGVLPNCAVASRNWHHAQEVLLGLIIEEVRNCARENLSRSPALSLASRDRVAYEQFQLPRSSLKKSQRKHVLYPLFAGQA
jgi:hypothetical protein